MIPRNFREGSTPHGYGGNVVALAAVPAFAFESVFESSRFMAATYGLRRAFTTPGVKSVGSSSGPPLAMIRSTHS